MTLKRVTDEGRVLPRGQETNIQHYETNHYNALEMAKLIAAMVAIASEKLSQLGDPVVIERIHKIFYHVYTEVATTLSRGQSQIRLTYMEKLIGVVQRKTRIATRDMNSQIHQYYEKFLTGRSYTFIDSSGSVHQSGVGCASL